MISFMNETTGRPAYRYRSVMLDCARHFFEISEIRKILEAMGILKLNVLHWHLSDDQGYRIESRRFPQLNTIGSFRNEDGSRYGGFYTFDEIRETVSFAADRGIQIVPEIDMPGHTTAILAACPELGSEALTGRPEIPSGGGIFKHILCPAKEGTLTFAKALLDEICDLFPSPLIHIGGDEAPKDEWQESPICQQKIRELALPDENALQVWFMNQLLDHLAEKGRKGIVWLEPGMMDGFRDNCVFQCWRKPFEYDFSELSDPVRLSDGSRTIIWSPQNRFYLDYLPAMNPMKGIFDAGEDFYANPALSVRIAGFECPLWTEMIETNVDLERMLFPRLMAAARIGWYGTDAGTYDTFLEEVRKMIPVFEAMGIACLPPESADPEGDERIRQVISLYRPFMEKNRRQLPEDTWPDFRNLFEWILSDRMQERFTPKETALVLKKVFCICN